jgi:RNA polymerase sigma-70 factor (family 1)
MAQNYLFHSITTRLANGDQKAFREVYENSHKKLFFIALKFLKSEELAKEAVQDAFVKLWEARKKLDPDQPIDGYLMAICRNHIFNILKKAKRDLKVFQEICQNQNLIQESVLEEIIFDDYNKIAKSAINNLPHKRREIFILCKEEGKSYQEIAQIHSISVGTVRDHMVKAGKAIKAYLMANAEIDF